MELLIELSKNSEIIIVIIGIITPVIYRFLQKLTQNFPSSYKKVGDKITPTLITTILRALFGKTATFYNCFVKHDPVATKELISIAESYLNEKLIGKK